MSDSPRVTIERCFAELQDPRRRKVTHPLINIVTIAICAVVCGADDFVSIADFGRKRFEWLSKFLDLSTGIPSHDRFNAILGALNVEEFQACLLELITHLHDVTEGQVVAIDGKTLRRSFDRASSKSAIHMVSAWATANQISLGQVVVDEKSNEITAIPKLLKMLEISGSLVTMDAMGCQTEIAQAVLDADADYVLAVKNNQPTLCQGITDFFTTQAEDDFANFAGRRYTTDEKGHGRVEHREYYLARVPNDLPDRDRWPELKAIGCAMTCSHRDGKEPIGCRYYILSKYVSGERFAKAVRNHGGIENQLHWQLDVMFQEGQSRIRKKNADANFSTLRRTAISLLKNNKTQKVGVKNRRLIAGWSEDYLQEIVFGK